MSSPVPEHRQRFVAEYVLPDEFGRELRTRYPLIAPAGIGKRALRQWLRIHLLAEERLVMPSRAVGILWQEFASDEETYRNFCHKAYGRLHHPPAVPSAPARSDDVDRSAQALTFAMACNDEGIPPHSPSALPVLFAVDAELGLADGERWVLHCGRQEICGVEQGFDCVYHRLLPVVPDDVPEQIRFDVPQPFPMQDATPDVSRFWT